ncbi:hypothetical protein KSS87_023106 [Heliosperma pusillum]|nr:hypothetical protein KSS87_017325 [Heliosperma pusillum]KAH9622521.1 hypothetical protein KSS87_023106 [Heliosperma pusillum]
MQPAAVSTPEKHLVGAVPPSPAADVEAGVAVKECWVKKKAVTLILRASALLFSVISFMLMVTVTDFTNYSALCYVFTIVLVVMIYTAVFVGIHGHEVRTGEVVIPPKVAVWMNFIGDQILALMLLSAGSAGAETVTALRQDYVGPAVDQLTASVAMTFLLFLALEPAALISTYNFSIYISKS